MTVSKRAATAPMMAACLFAFSPCRCDEPMPASPAVGQVLSLSLSPGAQDKLEFGQIQEVSLTLGNLSKRAIVALSIEAQENRAEDPIVLASTVYGSVYRLEDDDAYRYNGLAQQATELPFYAGLLLPGQEVSVACTYRPVSKTERFAVRYVSAEAEYDGSAESLRPLVVYVSDKEMAEVGLKGTYRPFVEREWLDVCRMIGGTGEVGPGISPRAVLIPGLDARPDVQIIEAPTRVRAGGFRLEKARTTAARIMRAEPADLTLGYSAALGGYVVLEGDESWLLRRARQASRGERLPALPLGMLRDLDETGAVRVRVGDKQEGMGPERRDAGWKLWDVYPVFYGDGMYTRGEFIEIDGGSLSSFLGQVREKRGSIAQQTYYFRSRYFVLELPGPDGG